MNLETDLAYQISGYLIVNQTGVMLRVISSVNL